ncbi:molecular chaperone DnaJ [Sediminicurvatus halobius]|uniref:Molecular chaperone DnaJ n=1 Tax=Sediminicurvatus halobius TaxID=2182432 RepID=A0A2U2N788_9GAMM|nr:molecular chaperone DnaJ [Spiribacter halobius]PWG64968.1 molecular chaperone DnaJ [Spiribacter halobius]UEX78173.1 molecular chaperone DnaJ [Spiribacter halobius]
MRVLGLLLLIGVIAFMVSPRLRAWLAARAPMLILGGIAVVFVVLAASGRLNWIFAAIAAALPLAWRALTLLQFLPWLRRLLGGAGAAGAGPSRGEGPRQPPAHSGLTRDEALQILGLEPGAGPDEIRAAHRRLIQRLHPDRGGSGYLAARLNEARDLLLEDQPGADA